MAGVGHWLYPNSGVDDNRGMLGYWIVWIGFAVFFTTSGLAMAQFALSASENTNPALKRSFCANNRLVVLCELVSVLTLSGFLTGGIWCSMETDLQVDEIVETFEPKPTDEIHVCFQIMTYSDVAMNFAYALLWLPVGFLLKAASQQRPVIVLGLPISIAATIAMISQWTVGSMLLVILFFVDFVTTKIDYFDAWNTIYGTVIYHWGMLMTLYCLHNLSYGLPLMYDDDDDNDIYNDEGPPALSWEWWVTMVAGRVPEPKENPNVNKEKENDDEKPDFDDEESNISTKDNARESAFNPNANSSTPRKAVSFDIEDEI